MLELPSPVRVDPDSPVENVFADPAQPGNPDDDSQAIAVDYLTARYAGPPPEGRDPRVISYDEVVPQTHHGVELRWPSREKGHQFYRWARANVIGFLALNVALNADQVPNVVRDTVEAAQGAKDQVEDELGIGQRLVERMTTTYKTEERTVLGHVDTTELFFGSKVGVAETETQPVEQLFTQLTELQSQGATIEKIDMFGRASDDCRASLGKGYEVADPQNEALAPEREKQLQVKLLAEARARGITLPEIDFHSAETVFSKDEHKMLEDSAKQFGYAGLGAAKDAFDTKPDSLPPVLHDLLQARIGKQRGVSLSIQFKTADRSFTAFVPHVEKVLNFEPDGEPTNHTHDYDPDLFFIPIPPIPKTYERPGTKMVTRKIDVPGVDAEDEWVRVYEEAASVDGTLKRDVWAYTRKYQEMLRDDRIKHVYNMGYLDGNGDPQTLRILFADHTPSFEAFGKFVELVQSFSQMREGAIGRNLKAIVVYPEENAGIEGNVPKQIGLGIDYQDERNVMGLAYYNFGLVEMHMPTDPSAEQLDSFNQAAWVLGHEVSGHYSTHTGEPTKLIPIDGPSERHFITTKPVTDPGKDEFNRLSAEELGQIKHRRNLNDWLLRRPGIPKGRLWWSRRGLQDLSGSVTPLEHDNLMDDDSKLRESLLTRIQNRFPTRYSRTNSREFWAEIVAQAVTGVKIPFSEQDGIGRKNTPLDPRYATGYAIGTKSLRLVQQELGSDPTADGIVWPNQVKAAVNWTHEMTTVETDPYLAPLAAQARTWDFRAESDRRLLHILARARRTVQSPSEHVV